MCHGRNTKFLYPDRVFDGMLSDLSDLQSSDEKVWNIDMSFGITTRSEEDEEVVEREYTFRYAPEFDKWMFQEYHERRTPDTQAVVNRDWSRSRHVTWDDAHEPRTIDVPPEVADALHEATGGAPVTIQVPQGGLNDHEYEEVRTCGD